MLPPIVVYVLPHFIASIAALLLASSMRQRRPARGGGAISIFLLATAWWNAGYAFELGSEGLSVVLFWARLEYLGIVLAPTCWFVFSLQYTGRQRFLTPLSWFLLAIEPAAITLLAWTNEAHSLIWKSIRLDSGQLPYIPTAEHGPAFWLHTAYAELLTLLAAFFILQAVLRSQQCYRAQAVSLIFAATIPWLSHALYLARLTRFDLTPLACVASGMAIAWGVFRFRLFDLVPVARDIIIKNMQDAVIVVDDQERLLDFNPAAQALIGCPLDQAVGRSMSEVCSPEVARLSEYLATTEMRGEVMLAGNAGPDNQQYFELHLMPLSHGLGRRQVARLMILHDISARKRAEVALARARDQAVEASKLKSRLLANVSHELRTPLNAIIGYTEMLQEDLRPEQQAWLHRIAYNAHQMTLFINDLLDQAALETGQLRLHLTEFSPAELLENTRPLLGALAEQKGLEITYSLDPFLPGKITGDLKRLQQILVNLVNNATKFTDQGGIAVKIYGCEGDRWALEVSDSGLGVPPEAQAFVFEPFRQVDDSVTRKNRGVGLGLSIVRQLTALMGGHIKLESQVGHGSTFTVNLPLKPAQEVSA